MRRMAGQTGFYPSNDEMVPLQHRHTEAAAPELATVKHYLGFYIVTSRPRLAADWPAMDSINVLAE